MRVDTDKTPREQRLWTKEDLAEFLGCKLWYIETKVRRREWPFYDFHTARFGPHHVEQILALHEQEASTPEIEASKPPVNVSPLRSRPPKRVSLPDPPRDFVPLRARPERARNYRG
jgi:hypothetical protein